MVEPGDDAPDFTVPLADGGSDVGTFTLSVHLDDAPLVFAFFPPPSRVRARPRCARSATG